MKTFNRVKRKAFTLVEALVAMGVTAVLMAFGVTGILSFRATVELQNANSDTFSFIRTLQNRARNSVSFTNNGVQIIPDYYAISVENSKLIASYCEDSGSSVICIPLPQQINQNISASINLSFDCDYVLFSTINENILELSNNTLADDSTCVLKMTHDSNSASRTMNIDISKNTINGE